MVTMKEIAKAAHVSQPTVSLILNKKSSSVRISEDTRKKVLETAERLGYRRNEVARSMKTGKTRTIGFLSNIPSGYTMEIVAGLSQKLDEHGYYLKLFMPRTQKEQISDMDVAKKCVEQRLDGVVCHALSKALYEKIYHELTPYNIPVIAADTTYPLNHCISVMTDEYDGALQATNHLIDLGHRKIGHLTSGGNGHFIKPRLDGYKQALNNASIDFSEEFVCKGAFVFGLTDEHERIITDYLKAVKPTAIFCSTDPLAMKLMQVAYKLKIRVPDDLSVVGFGGLDYSLIAPPALTTVDQPFYIIGEATAEKVISMSENGKLSNDNNKVLLPVKLLVRESTTAYKPV